MRACLRALPPGTSLQTQSDNDVTTGSSSLLPPSIAHSTVVLEYECVCVCVNCEVHEECVVAPCLATAYHLECSTDDGSARPWWSVQSTGPAPASPLVAQLAPLSLAASSGPTSTALQPSRAVHPPRRRSRQHSRIKAGRQLQDGQLGTTHARCDLSYVMDEKQASYRVVRSSAFRHLLFVAKHHPSLSYWVSG
jgi:hypothetical protein